MMSTGFGEGFLAKPHRVAAPFTTGVKFFANLLIEKGEATTTRSSPIFRTTEGKMPPL